MRKLEKLTDEQEAQISEYRDRYWRQAISTEPSDRPRAEAAARRESAEGRTWRCDCGWLHLNAHVGMTCQCGAALRGEEG